MKPKPILFSTPMVQAILEGRKTMTRRTSGLEAVNESPNTWRYQKYGGMAIGAHTGWKHQFFDETGRGWFDPGIIPKYQSGDILWAREAHYAYGWWVKEGLTKSGKQQWRFIDFTVIDEEGKYYYPGNPPAEIINGRPEKKMGWYKRSSLFMPFEAARIFLEVTNVRAERLQDISPDDACNEGVNYWNIDVEAFEGGELQADFKNYTWKDDPHYKDYWFPTFANPVDSFRTLWESINGPGSWEANPWVFVYEFLRTNKTITSRKA